ncbi:MAG: response regulator [Deltaproteobacteria bacterium]|nr:response regulator [Deltaproteobacteria bacterium]
MKRALLYFAALDGPFLGFELLMFVPMFQPYADYFFWLMGPSWIFLGFGFLNFAYRWIDRPNDWIYYSILATSLGAAIFYVFSGQVHIGCRITEYGVEDIRNFKLHALMALPATIGAVMGIRLLWLKRQQETDRNSRRIHDFLLAGSVLTLNAIVVADIILPDFFGTQRHFRLGSSLFVIFVIVVFLAVRKYRFLNFSIDEVAGPFFEKMRDAVLWVEDGTRVRRLNGTARRWFGKHQGYEGTPISHYLPSPEKQRLKVILNGRERWLKNSSYSIQKNNLEMLRVFILRDETEVHHARAVLRKMRDDLEKEATTRSERLLQAQRLEALATLSGGIAHEFNNLLTTIMGYTSAALDDISEENPIREDFIEVLHAAERARDIVKQMLSFSDMENREPTTLNVSHLVREALKLINISIPADVKVEFDNPDGMFTRGNGTRLHQAVINLLTNALHAMEKNGGRLLVRLSQKRVNEPLNCINAILTSGDYISITVADTGCGIPPQHLPRIFEPFYTTRKQGKGTGIGLATVFRVVEEHGGGILLQSTEGEGTRFELLLPAQTPQKPPEEKHSLTSWAAGMTANILVVDDNELVIKVIRRILEPLGYKVTAFTHPLKVLENLARPEKHCCDMALVDYGLPMMDGLTLSQRIRDVAPELPIILFSGKMTALLRRNAAQLGIHQCLSKPLSKQQLMDVVLELLSRQNGRSLS